MKKKSLLILAMLLMFNFSNVHADGEITVKIDGVQIEFDVPPQLIDNRTMVPLRKIFEAMGATVEWNGETQTVTAVKNNDRVIATVNNKNVYISGETKTLDVPPLIVDGRTLVPTRFVAEAFGANVQWDEATRTVSISNRIKISNVLNDKQYFKPDGVSDYIIFYDDFPDVPDFGAILNVPVMKIDSVEIEYGKNGYFYFYDLNDVKSGYFTYYVNAILNVGYKRLDSGKDYMQFTNDNTLISVLITPSLIEVGILKY